jgi:transcriptional regulator with XRE-family HTH domain
MIGSYYTHVRKASTFGVDHLRGFHMTKQIKLAQDESSKIGKNIRERRKLLGLSFADIGAQIGVSLQQVHKYETGHNVLVPSRLQQFASALRTKPAQILDTSCPSSETILSADSAGVSFPFAHTAETIDLTSAFDRICDPGRRMSVLALVETLAADD